MQYCGAGSGATFPDEQRSPPISACLPFIILLAEMMMTAPEPESLDVDSQ
jgi:hypothetical protein